MLRSLPAFGLLGQGGCELANLLLHPNLSDLEFLRARLYQQFLGALRDAGVDARPLEIGLALVEVETARLESARARLNGTLAGTTTLVLGEDVAVEEKPHA